MILPTLILTAQLLKLNCQPTSNQRLYCTNSKGLPYMVEQLFGGSGSIAPIFNPVPDCNHTPLTDFNSACISHGDEGGYPPIKNLADWSPYQKGYSMGTEVNWHGVTYVAVRNISEGELNPFNNTGWERVVVPLTGTDSSDLIKGSSGASQLPDCATANLGDACLQAVPNSGPIVKFKAPPIEEHEALTIECGPGYYPFRYRVYPQMTGSIEPPVGGTWEVVPSYDGHHDGDIKCVKANN